MDFSPVRNVVPGTSDHPFRNRPRRGPWETGITAVIERDGNSAPIPRIRNGGTHFKGKNQGMRHPCPYAISSVTAEERSIGRCRIVGQPSHNDDSEAHDHEDARSGRLFSSVGTPPGPRTSRDSSVRSLRLAPCLAANATKPISFRVAVKIETRISKNRRKLDSAAYNQEFRGQEIASLDENLRPRFIDFISCSDKSGLLCSKPSTWVTF